MIGEKTRKWDSGEQEEEYSCKPLKGRKKVSGRRKCGKAGSLGSRTKECEAKVTEKLFDILLSRGDMFFAIHVVGWI